METNGKRTIAAISAESTQLIRKMAEMKVGETISYDDLNKIVMGDIRKKKYHCLATARRHLLHEKQMVFETISTVGIQRASDSEIVENSSSAFKRINKISRREMSKLACADYEKLSKDEQLKHNANASMIATLRFITQPSQVKKLESKAVTSSKQLDLSTTLQVFAST